MVARIAKEKKKLLKKQSDQGLPSKLFVKYRCDKNIIIPPANFVCGGVYCFHVVRPSVRNVLFP